MSIQMCYSYLFWHFSILVFEFEFLGFGRSISFYFPFKRILDLQLVQEHMSNTNGACAFQLIPFMLCKIPERFWGCPKSTGSSVNAENAHQSTPRGGYMNVLLPQEKGERFDQGRVISSICIVDGGQVPQTNLAPKFVYYRSSRLTDLCRGNVGVLVDDLLSIFHSSTIDLEIFRRHLAAMEHCALIFCNQKYNEHNGVRLSRSKMQVRDLSS